LNEIYNRNEVDVGHGYKISAENVVAATPTETFVHK
jgi:hypothetical protein